MKWWDKCHDLSFWMLSFKPFFSLSSFTVIKRLFSSYLLSAIRVVYHLHICSYWYFSQQSCFQLVLHPARHLTWCTLHTGYISRVTIMFSFPNLESVSSSLSGSNCCFSTCIWISQEAGKVVWYSHLFKNFPQFVVTYTVKDFSVVNEAEIDVFLELLIQEFLTFLWSIQMLTIWFLFPLPFLNPTWTGNSRFMYCWSLAWRILSITLLPCEMTVVMR